MINNINKYTLLSQVIHGCMQNCLQTKLAVGVLALGLALSVASPAKADKDFYEQAFKNIMMQRDSIILSSDQGGTTVSEVGQGYLFQCRQEAVDTC